MTWNTLCFSLRQVRAEGRTHPASAQVLQWLGYAIKAETDDGSAALTDDGRAMLERIDRDTAQQENELRLMAQAIGRLYGVMLQKETVH